MSPISPLIHLVDDDDAVCESLALLIGTVGLRVAKWKHALPICRCAWSAWKLASAPII